MKILLVEADYKNAYPPMGLMKISTYHRSIGDDVYFTKGTNEKELEYKRIYITTLFTFYFKKTIDTINYYEKKYDCDIYVGGIASSIMSEKFKEAMNPRIHLLKGLLTDSSMIGYHDHINIDTLYMDYSILDQIKYVYKASTGYISYTTRGCVNKCAFCAVPKLEPEFCITNNIENQIENCRTHYGEKKDLLLLDNNILALDLPALENVVNMIMRLGFTKESRFKKEYTFQTIGRKIRNLQNLEGFDDEIAQLQSELVIEVRKHLKNTDVLNGSLHENLNWIYGNWNEILQVHQEHDKRVGSMRYVDFNQGMDARLLTEEKMEILSRLPIRPFRLAFDHVAIMDQYENSIRLAARYGIKEFSNYLLYNFEDDYVDLYIRMQFNIELARELDVKIHSFPMRYAPIHLTHRKNIGPKWNRYFLTNFRRILIPTKGVIGVGVDYFYNAFGNSSDEFKIILSMPYDLLIFRNFFRDNGITRKWKNEFAQLSEEEKEKLFEELSMSNFKYDIPIMKYYRIRKEKPETWKCFLDS